MFAEKCTTVGHVDAVKATYRDPDEGNLLPAPTPQICI